MAIKKRKSPIEFNILTIFPKIFDSYLGESLFKRAIKNGLIKINPVNLRDFSEDKHQKVDDRPFGGGPGMVLKIQPIYDAIEFAKRESLIAKRKKKPKIQTILFSTRGKKLTSSVAKRLAFCDKLILICGRYEGVDERVAEHIADEEISVGDYVLSGGELPALVLMEAVSRFIPGFLGKEESLEEINGSFPTYTRPEVFRPCDMRHVTRSMRQKAGSRRGWRVPKVLLSGDHKKINEWRARFSR